MTCGFLIQLVFCEKKLCGLLVVEVEQEKSASPPKKNPRSAPDTWTKIFQCEPNKKLSVLLSRIFLVLEFSSFHVNIPYICIIIMMSLNDFVVMFSATCPHSVGLATNDSPAGLAAYILEKFAMWSGCQTTDTAMCLESCFSKDDLLTNVMIYWATHSITSSMRLYYEEMHSAEAQRAEGLVTDFKGTKSREKDLRVLKKEVYILV